MDATTGYVSLEFFSFNQGKLPCQCIFCLDEIYDKGHVCCCPAIHGVIIPKRLKNLVYGHCVPKINREPETKLYNNRKHCDESNSSL